MFLFHGEAISQSLLLAFSVGMNVALVVFNLVLGAIALFLMARTLRWKRLEPRRPSEDAQAQRRHYAGRCRSRRSIRS